MGGDNKAAAFKKTYPIFGKRLPLLALEITFEEIVERFMPDASPPVLDLEWLVIVRSSEVILDCLVGFCARSIKRRGRGRFESVPLFSNADVGEAGHDR